MADDSRYDHREVGRILERVAELHEREGEKTDARSMSRVEIEQVVGELGISKALVARAAAEISMQDQRNRPVWWLGGKTDVMFEDVVDGRIDDATSTQMLEVLRRHVGDPGEVRLEGGARIWSTTSQTTRRIHFSVVEHPGNTTLRLEEHMPMDARATVGVATMAGWLATVMVLLPLKGLLLKSILLLVMGPLMAAGATVGWLIGRALWRHRSDTREERLRRTFGEILALAGRSPEQ